MATIIGMMTTLGMVANKGSISKRTFLCLSLTTTLIIFENYIRLSQTILNKYLGQSQATKLGYSKQLSQTILYNSLRLVQQHKAYCIIPKGHKTYAT